MKRYDYAVTVTGAGGFVGSHLCRRFLDGPYNVKVMATDRMATQRITDLIGEFGSDDLTFETYDSHQPLHSDFLAVDTFYHLSGIADPKVYIEDPIRVMDLNLDGLRNVLSRIVRWSAHRPRVVYTSTSEVYGKNAAVPFDEEATDLVFGPTQTPRWCYAMTKAVGEHYLRAYARDGVRHTIFRLFNIVGPDIDTLRAGRVFSMMVGDAYHTGLIRLVGDGQQTRCFTWVEDAVECMVRPTYFKKPNISCDPPTLGDLTFRKELDQTVNLGSDRECSMATLASIVRMCVEERTGSSVKVQRVASHEVYGAGYEDVPRRVPMVHRAKGIFGWEATTDLETMVERFVDAQLPVRTVKA